MNQIGSLAYDLLNYHFDYLDGTQKSGEFLTISGIMSGNLGELNTLLNQSFCYTGLDGNPYPRLGQEEGNILQEIYMRDYNTKQAQRLLRGIYDSNVSGSTINYGDTWTEIREGDTVIKRSAASLNNSASNRISMSRDFKGLAEESRLKIQELTYAYNMYGAQPRQVAGDDSGPVYDMRPGCPDNNIIIPPTPIDPIPVPSGSGIGPTGSGIAPTGSGIFPTGSGVAPTGLI